MNVSINVMPPKLIPMEPYKSGLVFQQSIYNHDDIEAYEAVQKNGNLSFMDNPDVECLKRMESDGKKDDSTDPETGIKDDADTNDDINPNAVSDDI